jgi:cytochrome c553
MLKKAKLKGRFIAAFLAIATAVSVSASAQTTKTQIQRMSSWQSCAACAGAGGAGPSASLYTVAGVVNPSLSGDSLVVEAARSSEYRP